MPGKFFIRGNAHAKGQKPVGLFETNLVMVLWISSLFFASFFPFGHHNFSNNFDVDNDDKEGVKEAPEDTELSNASTSVWPWTRTVKSRQFSNRSPMLMPPNIPVYSPLFFRLNVAYFACVGIVLSKSSNSFALFRSFSNSRNFSTKVVDCSHHRVNFDTAEPSTFTRTDTPRLHAFDKLSITFLVDLPCSNT